MAKRRRSTFTGVAKRYAAYKTIKVTEKAAKGMAHGIGGFFELICILFVVLIVGFSVVVALPFIIAAIIAIAVIILIVYLVRRKKANASQQSVPPPGSDLRRDVEVIHDCQNLVNNSENIETVAERYQMLTSILADMQKRPQSDFDYYGIKFSTPISDTLSLLTAQRSTIFCQAIDRAFAKCSNHIAGLKTEKGKQNALYKFHCDTRAIILRHNLPDDCIAHLDTIVGSFM